MNIRQEILAHTKKILVKVGSAVLTGDEGLDLKVIDSIVQDMSDLKTRGYDLVLVTSGAILGKASHENHRKTQEHSRKTGRCRHRSGQADARLFQIL